MIWNISTVHCSRESGFGLSGAHPLAGLYGINPEILVFLVDHNDGIDQYLCFHTSSVGLNNLKLVVYKPDSDIFDTKLLFKGAIFVH